MSNPDLREVALTSWCESHRYAEGEITAPNVAAFLAGYDAGFEAGVEDGNEHATEYLRGGGTFR